MAKCVTYACASPASLPCINCHMHKDSKRGRHTAAGNIWCQCRPASALVAALQPLEVPPRRPTSDLKLAEHDSFSAVPELYCHEVRRSSFSLRNMCTDSKPTYVCSVTHYMLMTSHE